MPVPPRGRSGAATPGPTALGIGAQKCASSWVHAALAAHPAIGVPRPKELDYFSYYFDRGHAWYEGFFDGLGTRAVRFEASPSYFHDPRAPGRVRDYDAAMRIVVLLRDPVARAISNHHHEVIKGHIPPLSFAAGLANNPAYLEQSRYARHLAAWLAAFPRDQVLVLLAEEIAADPGAAAETLYRFLGVDPLHRTGILDERRNRSDMARSPMLRRALRAQGDLLRRLGLEEQLMRAKRWPGLRHLLAFNSVEVAARIPAVDAAMRARLAGTFAGDMDYVAALLGRDRLPWPSWELRG